MIRRLVIRNTASVYCMSRAILTSVNWRHFVFSRESLVLCAIVIVFLLVRIPGLSQPLHQDEYKWPMMADPATEIAWEIPHPPLTLLTFRTAGYLVGFDQDFRLVPLTFGLLNLLLLYYFARRFFSVRTAQVSALVYTLAFFSVLASLMVDTDGQVMPFFFLLSLIAYYTLKEEMARGMPSKRTLVFFVLALFGGMMVKLSFGVAILAFVLDFAWEYRRKLVEWASHIRAWHVGAALGFVAVVVAALTVADVLLNSFNYSYAIDYWLRFATIDRGWFQTFIQVAKAVLYLSPFLVLAPFFLARTDVPRVRPLILYILSGLFFYVVLLDFSAGALDRYLEYVLVPLSVIAAVLLVRVFGSISLRQVAPWVVGGVVLSALISLLQFAPHSVPALHPKVEWIGRILSFEWNFVYPFSGGSGPLTFYMSFLFIGVTWLVGLALGVVVLARERYKPFALSVLVVVSLVYSGWFTEEYLFGYIHGSASTLVRDAAQFIRDNDDITRVVVYNDNGGNEVRQTGKYEKRLYTSPQFDVGEKIETINAFSGHYLVIDAPPIDPTSVYAAYLATCTAVYERRSQKMSAVVYDCRGAPDIVP